MDYNTINQVGDKEGSNGRSDGAWGLPNGFFGALEAEDFQSFVFVGEHGFSGYRDSLGTAELDFIKGVCFTSKDPHLETVTYY